MGKMIKEVWAHLDADCMSGDKIDHGSQTKSKSNSKSTCNKRSIIQKLLWRDDVKFEPFLRVCDTLYYSTRFDEDGRVSPGLFPFQRVASNRLDPLTSIPKTLPSNFYNKKQIEEMKKSGDLDVKLLRMKSPADLIFSKNVLR